MGINPTTTPPPSPSGTDPSQNQGQYAITIQNNQVTVTGTTPAANAAISANEATIQQLQTDVTNLNNAVNAAINNMSNPDVPGGHGADTGNPVLLAQFPNIALAMNELADTLMKLGFSMAKLGIDFTKLTILTGEEAKKLQINITKAEITQTQGDIVGQTVNLAGNLGMAAFAMTKSASVNKQFNKEDEPLAKQEAALDTKLNKLEEDEKNGVAPPTQPGLTIKANYQKQRDAILKDKAKIVKQRAELKETRDQQLRQIPQTEQQFSAAFGSLGNIISSSMKLASQQALLPLQGAQQNLNTAVAPIFSNALQNTQSASASAQSAFDALMQQIASWVSARDAMRYGSR